jgi:hypothetical protein
MGGGGGVEKRSERLDLEGVVVAAGAAVRGKVDFVGGDDRPIDRWASERETVLSVFTGMLAAATGDGSRKRQSGEKPPWWRDHSHEAAIFSHLNKWKHGERFDKDSGVHPLVHLAWRALAVAYQETEGLIDPEGRME